MAGSKKRKSISRRIKIPVKGYGFRRFSSIAAVRKLKGAKRAQYDRIVNEFIETPNGSQLRQRMIKAFEALKENSKKEPSDFSRNRINDPLLRKFAAEVNTQVAYFRHLLIFAERKSKEKGLYKSTLETIEKQLEDFEKQKDKFDSLEDLTL